MNEEISLLRAAAHPNHTEGVTETGPSRWYRPDKCEFCIEIGVFFDGTGNNQDWAEPGLGGATQLQRKKDSNVARLYRAYPDNKRKGYYPLYIPGVGTPFPEIGEDGPRALGMGFGAGGNARILFGMLHILNAMHGSLGNYDTPMIDERTVKALCTNGWLPLQNPDEAAARRISPADLRALEMVDMKHEGGLLTMGGISHRTKFLKQQFAQLAQRIADTRAPKLVEVFIDVFGFSRGAAQARVFCNWLDECFEGDTLGGVKAHIRFLGIFDTVAAVSLGPAAGRWTDGHYDWGEPKNLRLSPRVRHCEHYVAMHEQRESFPLDDICAPGEAMPPRCRQFRFPGMHSDLGGGYLPEEQGKNGGEDENKLARIPLNMLYQAARAARVPLDSDNATVVDGWNAFAISDRLQSDYTAFIQANGTGVRAISDCLIDILAWRYLHRHVYETLPFFQNAGDGDKEDLLGAHRIFMNDIGEVYDAQIQLRDAKEAVGSAKLSLRGRIFRLKAAEHQYAQAAQAKKSIPKARREILEKVVQRQPGDVELTFFNTYCHDSYAGFKPLDTAIVGTLFSRNAPWESGGYLRYRTRYAGENLRLAMHELHQKHRATAAAA